MIDRLWFRSFGEKPFNGSAAPILPQGFVGEEPLGVLTHPKTPENLSSNNYSLNPYTLTPNGTEFLAFDDDD